MLPATLDLTITRWLFLVGAGALVGLDGASWPQAMISRPLVAGTLGGLAFGQPAAGFLAGALLELFTLRHPPYGAARYPEGGPAGLTAGAAYGATGAAGFLPLLLAALAGWGVSWVGARSVHALRVLNGRLVGDPSEAAARPERLVRRHRLAMRLDAARGALLVAAFLVPVAMLARMAAGVPPGPSEGTWAAAAAVAGLAGLSGAAARGLDAPAGAWPLLLAGALVGGLVAW